MSVHLHDGYKGLHGPMYPEKTEYVYSNLTPRSNRYANTEKLTVFGIQALMLKYFIEEFNTKFFNLPIDKAVKRYKRKCDNTLGPGVVSMEHIADLHKLGFLPVHVKALPEGVEVGMKIPVMTIINTIKKFFWVTNFLETLISTVTWQPMTNASIAREFRRILVAAAKRTGTPLEFVDFQGHDFSMRGMSSIESATASAAAHALSFVGSDTGTANDYLEDYYGADGDKEMITCTVPATEHSVMCMGEQYSKPATVEITASDAIAIHLEQDYPELASLARTELPDGYYESDANKAPYASFTVIHGELATIGAFPNPKEGGCVWSIGDTEQVVVTDAGGERNTFLRMLNLFPVGIVSIVSDTWDFWKVMTELAPSLKKEIRARKPIMSYIAYDYSDPCVGELELQYDLGVRFVKLEDGTYRELSQKRKGAQVVLAGEIDPPVVIVPGKTVFRPDSGCPVKILTGYKTFYCGENGDYDLDGIYNDAYEAIELYGQFFKVEFSMGRAFIGEALMECEVKGAVETLWDSFGGSKTDKGFKQLEEVGLIYGDSITLERAQQIVDRLADKGFASGNVVLGIGSYTYQMNTRDTYGMAIKATWGQVDGVARNIMKDPKTDDGTKKSATGLLRVELENGEYVLYDKQTKEQEKQGELKTVFRNGKAYNLQTLAEIRERVKS